MNDQQLIALFPAFLEIQEEGLRDKALQAMRLAMEQGGWNAQNIGLCPVTLNWKDCDVSWVEHVTDVTQVCLLQYHALEKYYRRHGVAFSRDLVVCGALLHDIGKLTEFVPQGDRAVHSADYLLLRHPLSGAILAAQAQLPASVIHLIATHSFEGDRSWQTAESAFVRATDLFVFECGVRGLEKRG